MFEWAKAFGMSGSPTAFHIISYENSSISVCHFRISLIFPGNYDTKSVPIMIPVDVGLISNSCYCYYMYITMKDLVVEVSEQSILRFFAVSLSFPPLWCNLIEFVLEVSLSSCMKMNSEMFVSRRVIKVSWHSLSFRKVAFRSPQLRHISLLALLRYALV